jgi:hypothetical protein
MEASGDRTIRTGQSAAKRFAESAVPAMISQFINAGTFWEVGNFMAGWDRHFGFRDWARVFRTVPSLRKYLVPALAWNVLLSLGGRKGYQGYSERYVPGRKYNFRYRSFCTDFLVWESIGRAASHFGIPVPKETTAILEAYSALAFRNCYAIPWEGMDLPLFSYFPRHDHLVPRGDAVYKLFFSRDDNVPDLDTTALVLGSLIQMNRLFGVGAGAYGHRREESEALLGLMEQHVFGRGRFGRKSLSYDNGILPDDEGVMTWVFDEHNELDPTSNINILNWLAVLPALHPDVDAGKIAGLARGILRFLHNHVLDGSFLDERFQSYYPLGPVYHFWRRFMENYRASPDSIRKRLDPDGAASAIDGYLAARGEELFRKEASNPFDRLVAAPFLYEHGIMKRELAAWVEQEEGLTSHFLDNHYEIFHLRYPSKIICAPLSFPQACGLELAILVDKNPLI